MRRALCLIALVVLLASACGDVHPPSVAVPPAKTYSTVSAPRSTTTTTVDNAARWYSAAAARDRWFAVARLVEAARRDSAVPPRPVMVGRAVALPAGECWSLLAKYFSDVLAWARRIVMRESGCTAAVNWREGCDTSGRTNSHAMGPWQICWPQHAAAGSAVGCSNPLDFECNMRIARYLYDREGRAPWGG